MLKSRSAAARWLLAYLVAASLAFSSPAEKKPHQKSKLPRPEQLDRGVALQRDPATGELRYLRTKPSRAAAKASSPRKATFPSAPAAIHVRVNLVEVGVNVLAPDGTQVRGLGPDDFRIFEGGAEQSIAHFDAANEPASIILVMDASPSVYRELGEMKHAARTLAASLSPLDEVAVVRFAVETQVLLPFSRDRVLLERAIRSIELEQGASEDEGSNIYQAVYLSARELFPGRAGRKAILLLTDGQDSGLGLSWDPSSALPRTGTKADKLTFEDVGRALAAAGIEVYAVSTQNRPNAMTEQWLTAHRKEMLVTHAARELGMPHYTLYLAELVRRVGGQLYFLREIGTLSEVYRRIADSLGAQYTLDYYPSGGVGGPVEPGWRSIRVEVKGRPPWRDLRLKHRVAYYVPAIP